MKLYFRFKQCHAVEVSNHFELLKASRAAGRDFCPNSYIENKNEQNDCSCLSEISIRCSGTPQLVNFDNGTISIGSFNFISKNSISIGIFKKYTIKFY